MRHRALAVAMVSGLLCLIAGSDPAGAATDPRDSAGPLDITSGEFRQHGVEMVLKIGTRGAWTLKDLSGSPKRYLCLQLRLGRGPVRTAICVGRRRGTGKPRLTRVGTSAGGRVLSVRPIEATITRPDQNSIKARFRPDVAGLVTGTVGWQLVSSWDGPECSTPELPDQRCVDRVPDGTQLGSARIRPPIVVGCDRGGPTYRTNGPREQRLVALTFDDGPSPYTSRILEILRSRQAAATFFVLGDQIPGRESLLREELHDGHEIGDHSFNHAYLPGASQLARTNARIRAVTGFEPCLFRAPYGAVSGGLISEAQRAGMTTIEWDVDPRDWSLPGADSIYHRVVDNVHPGSIVVMHDGGGPRSETIAALPRILATLAARGYRFVTVSELLGHDSVFKVPPAPPHHRRPPVPVPPAPPPAPLPPPETGPAAPEAVPTPEATPEPAADAGAPTSAPSPATP